MTSVVRLSLAALLIVGAIGQILNQHECTYNLVEAGISTWQVSRIIVLALPGLQLVLAVMLAINSPWTRITMALHSGLLIAPVAALLVSSGRELSYAQNLFLPWSTAGAWLFMILIVAADSILLWRRDDLPKSKWYWSLLLLPLLSAGMIDEPVYRDDFMTREAETPDDYDVPLLLSFLDGEGDRYPVLLSEPGVRYKISLDQRFAVFFFLPDCDHCMEKGKELHLMIKGFKNQMMPVFLVFSTTESNVKLFMEKTGLDLPYVNLNGEYKLTDIAGSHMFPTAMIIDKGKMVSHRNGLLVNYNFFDQVLL